MPLHSKQAVWDLAVVVVRGRRFSEGSQEASIKSIPYCHHPTHWAWLPSPDLVFSGFLLKNFCFFKKKKKKKKKSTLR
jgi:hypothetical protein